MTTVGKSIGSESELQRRAEASGDMHLPARPIVLIGLMGAGKSSVGRKLAAEIGRPFVDADAEIEAAAGCSINEIFERLGEPAFREGERRVIARLLDGPLAVIASGGGAFIEPETRALIIAKSISVWLRADLEVLVKRTAGRTHRPILNAGEPREVLRKLLERRYPVYAEADMTVDTFDQPTDSTVEQVLSALQSYAAAPAPLPT
ncbi:MAG TPA: shikimate kinase [Magnetospirillaceae bacterium]|jgi:shikimate kinase